MKKHETFINISKTWQYAKGQKKRFVLYSFCSLILSVISAITPVLSAQQLLKLSNNLLSELLIIGLIVFIVEITRNGFRYLANKFIQVFFRETTLKLQSDIAKEMLKLETEIIDNHSSGVFIERISNDTSDISNIFSEINDTMTEIVTNIGILIAIFIVNKYVFIFFVISLIILFLFKKARMKYFYMLDKEYRKLREKNTGMLAELVRGLKDIKVLNGGQSFTKKMHDRLLESNQKRYEMSRTDRNYRLAEGFIQDLMILLFLILCIYLVQKDMLSISNFVILFMYKDKVYMLLNYLARFVEIVKRFDVSAKRVFELFDNEKYPKEKFGDKNLKKLSGNFEFRSVSFEYKENVNILKDVNFKINANETVAFVGKSGAGKSTIFSLLTKLYHVKKGEILIDNINIDELDEQSIRNNITIITQSPYIFNFSIKENLKIIDDSITDEEMIDACKLACLHDFIMTLPEQYDTIVGEGGVMLSGGERQRLAIARALLKKSEIILFDEATSSLDNQTQKDIQQAINNMKGEYTILIIAHRLSTVINSDRIIIIDDGKVAGDGNHKELYNNNELYRNLYEKELTE